MRSPSLKTMGSIVFAAAEILDQDRRARGCRPLRKVARTLKRFPGASTWDGAWLGDSQLAVFVEDQGRVEIHMGEDSIPGSAVRRKVLALLCFLLSRPNMSATTRPGSRRAVARTRTDVAVNSLNQTVYFLRRVFEPAFSEDMSPGYVHHDSDVVWLDPSWSRAAPSLPETAIRRAERDPSPENVERVSRTYRRSVRTRLRVRGVVGRRIAIRCTPPISRSSRSAVSADTNGGEFDRAIGLARRAIEADPEAEQVELSLLRLYRRTGAHAAAAEQYAHYAACPRNDLGMEPPPLESL